MIQNAAPSGVWRRQCDIQINKMTEKRTGELSVSSFDSYAVKYAMEFNAEKSTQPYSMMMTLVKQSYIFLFQRYKKKNWTDFPKRKPKFDIL